MCGAHFFVCQGQWLRERERESRWRRNYDNITGKLPFCIFFFLLAYHTEVIITVGGRRETSVTWKFDQRGQWISWKGPPINFQGGRKKFVKVFASSFLFKVRQTAGLVSLTEGNAQVGKGHL